MIDDLYICTITHLTHYANLHMHHLHNSFFFQLMTYAFLLSLCPRL